MVSRKLVAFQLRTFRFFDCYKPGKFSSELSGWDAGWGKWQTCHALLLYPVILAFLCPSLSFVGNTKAFCISTRITDHQGTQDRKAAGKRRWRW